MRRELVRREASEEEASRGGRLVRREASEEGG